MMRISLTKEMSERTHRLQMFFESLKMHSDEEFVSSIGIVCLNAVFDKARQGYTIFGFDGPNLVAVPFDGFSDAAYGREFDRWYLHNVPEDMIVACTDLQEAMQVPSLEDVVLCGVYVLSQIVDFLEEGYELVQGCQTNEADTAVDYWTLEVFDRFRPRHVQ